MGGPGAILIIPLVAILMLFGVPLIAILLRHQQRMAELLNSRPQPLIDPRIDALQHDMAALKDLVHQQTIALDRLSSLPRGNEVQQRIGD
ncbi:hypothetical protein EON82_07385 [bacterium]|nr:MAG: hypothetical protein EON82_07385 [bacterium]